MRIDSHQHFWTYAPNEYYWMTEEKSALRRDFLPPDINPLLAGNRIDGTVVVQARQSLEETRWLLELSDRFPYVKAVVGWVDLCSPEVDRQLERIAAHPRLSGVRHLIQDEPDDAYFLRPDFLRGLGALARHGLRYDICIYERQLPATIEAVSRFPVQPFVLDHIGKPRIKEHSLEPWATNIRRLASLPNVCCKLSGLVTEADWIEWQPSDLTPYLDVVLDAFGPDRLMFGSDWPVCTLAAPYDRVLAIIAEYVSALSTDEQNQIMGETAWRFYGLKQ